MEDHSIGAEREGIRIDVPSGTAEPGGTSPARQPQARAPAARGGVPPFALEIVSSDKGKDYVLAPQRHDELGTREFIVYDPSAQQRQQERKFQVFRRVKGRGLVQVEATDGDR